MLKSGAKVYAKDIIVTFLNINSWCTFTVFTIAGLRERESDRQTERWYNLHTLCILALHATPKKRMGEIERREGMDAPKSANPAKVKTAVTQGEPLTHPKQWRPWRRWVRQSRDCSYAPAARPCWPPPPPSAWCVSWLGCEGRPPLPPPAGSRPGAARSTEAPPACRLLRHKTTTGSHGRPGAARSTEAPPACRLLRYSQPQVALISNNIQLSCAHQCPKCSHDTC